MQVKGENRELSRHFAVRVDNEWDSFEFQITFPIPHDASVFPGLLCGLSRGTCDIEK